MSTKTTEPPWVAQGRVRKADTIATALRTIGATADDVAHFTPKDRRMAEKAAGITNRGSDDTWRLVAEMLAGSTRPLALCPFCVQGDPMGEVGPPKPYGHTDGLCTRR